MATAQGKRILVSLVAMLLVAGCSSRADEGDPGPPDAAPDVQAEDPGTNPDDVLETLDDIAIPDTAPTPDAVGDAGDDDADTSGNDATDTPAEDATDTPADDATATADAPSDTPGPTDASDTWDVPSTLPRSLPFAFTRPDEGTPIPDDEVRAFTRKILDFLDQIRYFDYLLYTTHGVDASSGKPDWQFWYNERFRKDGDLVTFYHPVNLNDGGHNLHIPLSRVLGDTIAAWLVTGDPTIELAAGQMCKGMSASMLGMAYDADDPYPFVMSRNLVPAYSAEFLTHDGKRKGVDPSGYFSAYTRWNADRFLYADNPTWGPVWVTNLRSKDDLPFIFTVIPNLRHAAEAAPEGPAKAACGQALDLLTRFAKDIVDQDFRIRTKDADGQSYFPGYTGDPARDAEWGDISTFTYWRDIIPEGECNARRGAELIAYHRPVNEECGRGEPNAYDDISFISNGYNKEICRFFHLSHLANALASWDVAGAALLMDGLDERTAVDEVLGTTQTHYTAAKWERDLALFQAQSHAFGFPLKADEARRIMDHYSRAVDETASWPYWNPWAATVPDGDLGAYRPPNCRGDDQQQVCWLAVQDLAQIFETCWSPYVNPAGAKWVDCDLVRAWRYRP